MFISNNFYTLVLPLLKLWGLITFSMIMLNYLMSLISLSTRFLVFSWIGKKGIILRHFFISTVENVLYIT